MKHTITVWVAVEIDHYGGDMLDCDCTFNNFAGDVKFLFSKKDADAYEKQYTKDNYAGSVRIVKKELEVDIPETHTA